jgi:hypothetical protein
MYIVDASSIVIIVQVAIMRSLEFESTTVPAVRGLLAAAEALQQCAN